jgi:hypothetical protein
MHCDEERVDAMLLVALSEEDRKDEEEERWLRTEDGSFGGGGGGAGDRVRAEEAGAGAWFAWFMSTTDGWVRAAQIDVCLCERYSLPLFKRSARRAEG